VLQTTGIDSEMTSELCRLIVIRHSERADDVEELAWKKLVSENKLRGGRKCFTNDPIISSKDGVSIARQMAQSVDAIINNNPSGAMVHLYASRLLRATQTASFLSRSLNVPIRISSGLAQIIPAVRNSKEGFEFASISELTRYCPSVDFIDCDDVRSPEDYLPAHSWRAALDTLLAKSDGKNIINIVVAHRETVRKLAGEYMDTPYCCLGMFAIEYTASACASQTKDTVDEPSEIVTNNDGYMSGGSSTNASATSVTGSAKEEHKESTVTSLGNSSNINIRADSKKTLVRKPSPSVKSGTDKIPVVVKGSHSIPASVRVMKPQPKGKVASADSKSVVCASKPASPPLYKYVDSIRLVTLLSCDGTVLK